MKRRQAWFDGQPLKFDDSHRAAVQLKAGVNTVLVRLEDVKSQGRGLYVRLDPAAPGAGPVLRATPAADLEKTLQAPRS